MTKRNYFIKINNELFVTRNKMYSSMMKELSQNIEDLRKTIQNEDEETKFCTEAIIYAIKDQMAKALKEADDIMPLPLYINN